MPVSNRTLKNRKLIPVATTIFFVILAVLLGVSQSGFLNSESGAGTKTESASKQEPSTLPNPKNSEPAQALSTSSEDIALSSSEGVALAITCAIKIDGKMVDIPCDDEDVDWEKIGLPEVSTGASGSSAGSGSTDQSGNDDREPGEPRAEETQTSAADNSIGNDTSQDFVWCPNERSDDPKLYDACWQDFTEPSFVFAGIHSCRVGEYEGEPAIEVTARIELSGGNYKDHYMIGEGRNWDGTNKGYVLLSKGWIVGPNDYEVLIQIPFSWYVTAHFYPMQKTFEGENLEGFREVGAWVDHAVKTADLPSNCWKRP